MWVYSNEDMPRQSNTGQEVELLLWETRYRLFQRKLYGGLEGLD